ncbi:MAG: hypothetical protein PWQ79_2124 [Thermococcaceae archaeon]|nr:hypothetical protein [Thermococcaceae archaeon]MDK2915209.1 hypothetical protein [Thermococcaceae archaeon]
MEAGSKYRTLMFFMAWFFILSLMSAAGLADERDSSFWVAVLTAIVSLVAVIFIAYKARKEILKEIERERGLTER